MSEIIPQNQEENSIAALHSRVAELEKQLQMQSLELEALVQRVPDTMIISPNFLKRAFTVYGHTLVAGLIIAIPIWCISLTIALLLGATSGY
jgi:hypothetical protein